MPQVQDNTMLLPLVYGLDVAKQTLLSCIFCSEAVDYSTSCFREEV